MPTVNLTTPFVRSAECPATQRRVDYFDADHRGFLLEVRSSGGKTFYQRYSDARGRQKQCKLGSADVLILDQAREKGREIVAAVLLGSDPQQRRLDLRAVPTLTEFVRDRYLPYAKQSKRSWKVDECYLRRHIQPSLGRLRLDEITHEGVNNFVQEMRGRNYAIGSANRALGILQHALNLARRWKVPGAGENTTKGISAGPEVFRQRFLTVEEAGRLMKAIASEPNRPAANAIMLLLLTGARRNEIVKAKWSYVDWDRRTLLVPLSKSGKPRTIALSGAALSLLSGLIRGEDEAYIFASEWTEEASVGVQFPFERIRNIACLSDLRLHDLRHSFASFLVNSGVPLYTVQGLLGHAHSRTTQRYAHLAPQTLLDATEVIASVVGMGAPETLVRS